jgi:hypothetical protein
MNWSPLRLQVAIISLLAVPAVRGAENLNRVGPDHPAKMQEALDLFRQKVRPALVKHCVECHSGADPKAGFDLSTRQLLGDSGTLADSAEESSLYLSVAHLSEPHMPRKRPKLPDETIAEIKRWIELGAPYDSPLVGATAAAPQESQVSDADRNFWSFRPLADPAPPDTNNDPWLRTPIDRFILAQLREKGLAPNPPAEKRTLVRRLYLDLIGLPPTPEEVEKFLAGGDGAYERLVDEVLASRHFGERWAQHWLDVARFAESDGFEHDSDRPLAYHYRDFVIQAINEDLPFDTFVRWQVAGDEIEPKNPLAWIATGFLTGGVFPTQITEAEFERTRYDQLDDMIATTGVAFLGLTVGCARCHDHKYDPIRSQDYYRLLSTFGKTVRSEKKVDRLPFADSHASDQPTVQVGCEGLPPTKSHADDRGYPSFYPETYILGRGDPEKKLQVAKQDFLPVLMRNGRDAAYWQSADRPDKTKTYQRRALANWLTDVNDGGGNLLARVIVNRLWQHHIGRGIVATPNDFGNSGERPSNPELLDWLASELVRNGWHLKPIHKLILTSSVYRQSSASNAKNAQRDRENIYCWRFQPRRLEAEAIRDCLLACSGRLDRTMFGPGSLDEAMHRRSIYFTVKRSQMIPSMQLFDRPESLVSISTRASTTTAPQALFFMNSPLVRSAAEAFAGRLKDAVDRSLEDAIECAFRIALARDPSAKEVDLWRAMIASEASDYGSGESVDGRHLAIAHFCQLLLSTSEFVYLR